MAGSATGKGAPRGAIAGLVGGLAMAVFLGIAGLVGGGSFALAAQIGGYGIWGQEIFTGGAGPLFVGFLIHLVFSALWGLAYGWVIWGQPKGLTVFGGISWGSLAWAVMFYAVAPWAGEGVFLEILPLGRSLLASVIYGLVLGLAFLPMQERSARPGRIVPRHWRTAPSRS